MNQPGTDRIDSLNSWHSEWSGVKIAVLGMGVTGFSVADTLHELGAQVDVIAASVSEERARILDVLGISFLAAPDEAAQLDRLREFDPELIVTSPGYALDNPLLLWAADNSVPVWGDIELAWRLRDKTSRVAEWICITGTNGKTTTTSLTAHMLKTGGIKTVPVGNIGTPILDAIRDPEGFDVLVVELSSFQLARMNGIVPYASVCLNIADDHIDWHGSRAEYELAKAKVYANTKVACVYNRQDPTTEQMVIDADVTEGARAVSFGLDAPPVSGLGLVEDLLVDRGFHEERRSSGLELADTAQLERNGLNAPHLIQDVLAAAALARSAGVSPEDISAAISSFKIDKHRVERVATCAGVTWIDDSKATNTHAAKASLTAFDSIVWILGGLLKGQSVTELVADHSDRLKAAIVIGVERSAIVDALQRHAPDIPIFEVTSGETEDVMSQAVAKAREIAVSGDTVLLSPAAASMDQFLSYEDRGNKFQEAVHSFCEGGTLSGQDEDLLAE